ncbi:hypothetical protein PsorP6_004192 [Peronosclerospora sorghi]|uniref:Uncharacterized protein n=1 Tax=Peronosclerospora sorghi TaxID=230839 RepID=A0ACC0VKE1_9STRA|nr:hypothetical protein PsorP6_004192 [Peronosclerospora sorghi]
MGQQMSQPTAVMRPPEQPRTLRAPYRDVVKDMNADYDSTDARDKILEFGATLCYLPKEGNLAGRVQKRSRDELIKELVSSVDSVDELFQQIFQLAGLLTKDEFDPSRPDTFRDVMPGMFNTRVASYVNNLQTFYQLTLNEKYRYGQQVLATRAYSMSLHKVSPPPLPLPTQNCLTMGWDLVVMLLKATRYNNPEQYEQALQMVKEHLKPLKPTAYSESVYLATSASLAFNQLSECLSDLAYPVTDGASINEKRIGALTTETLAEVGLARGSLATMLFVVVWMMKQPPTTPVAMDISIAKLAALKEQPMYGKFEASNELYSCGQNSYGELGTGDDVERRQLTSVALCGWDNIRQVASGNELLAVLTRDGIVLSCGLNKSGQCGQGHFDERVMMLRPVQALRSQRVKFLAASNGCEHVIALTDSGHAYSWGYNDRGQLGHENLATKICVPKLIESLKDKKLGYASVSYHHSAVITDSGELFTFGMNDCGQLGLDHTQHQSTPQLVKCLEGIQISMVACGLYHTLICTSTGKLLSCGKNDYGQLGLAHNRQVKVPNTVPIANELIAFVACGYYHSVIVTTNGRTFSFGRNDYGQLGIGSKIHQSVPSPVIMSANTLMARATCGCFHTVLLSEQGEVFVFGRNNKGQLGNRGSADALLPVPLKVRPEKNFQPCVDVAAGFYTTSLVIERKRKNDDSDSVLLDQSCVIPVCGSVDIDHSGEVEGLSNFGSISTAGVSLFKNKWFYEVEVVTSGLVQVGWIDGYFQGSSDQGEGVGDHVHSWSYDGNRQRRWNCGSSSYGEKWTAGDIIGCLLDLDTYKMTFYRNGVNLGVAFNKLKCSEDDKRSCMMPGISLERGEIIRVNLGHQPFVYPPVTDTFESISRAITLPSSSVIIQTSTDRLTEVTPSNPPSTKGSASAMVGNKLFVIGGMLVKKSSLPSPSDPTNQVWVYDTNAESWDRWADFPIGICNHQVVAIDDSHILVLGGENNSPASRHMDLYLCSTMRNVDGSLPAWTLVQAAIGAANSTPQARAFHTVSTVRARLDTIVFMYGGKSVHNEILGDAWILALRDYAWSRLAVSASLDPGPRSGCSSAAIGDCVYIFGGQDSEKFRADLWKYNTFDRLWLLCHDDNVGVSVGGSTRLLSVSSRTNNHLPTPEGRINYSMCADVSNIWIFGGMNRTNTYLCDMWCFSTTLQKWNLIDVNTQDELDGCCSAAMYVSMGAVTALPSTSDCMSFIPKVGDVFLYGGRISLQGSVSWCSKVRKVSSVNSTGSYSLHATKDVSTTGTAGHVLCALRKRCGTEKRLAQHCAAETADTAICLLAHLDRLAGNDIPEDVKSVQLSRCLYRSLCIDPNERTFSALSTLLETLQSRFLEASSSVEDVNFKTSYLLELYPLLVTIRLLKLNFFEFSRRCLDESPAEDIKCEQAFGSIREVLFAIADHVLDLRLSGEVSWFYHAVKNEAVAAIYHGFSSLYPSILDKVQIMNRLMVNNQDSVADLSPAQKLLLPMLVPCFTSAKMLFHLIDEPENLSDATFTETVIAFLTSLLEVLRKKTKDLMEYMPETINKLISILDAIETSHEFKCVSILLRAIVIWCSHTVNQSWRMIESVCTNLVAFIVEGLNHCLAIPFEKSQLVLVIIQHSFAGKLLSFLLLSATSLSSIRDSLPARLISLWTPLKNLSAKLDSTLSVLSENGILSWPDFRTETSDSLGDYGCETEFVDTALVSVSNELSTCLLLQHSGSSLTYGHIFTRLWDKIIKSRDYTHWKVKELPHDAEIRRIQLPMDLTKLFGAETLLVWMQKIGITSGVLAYDSKRISFMPSRTIISQHIYPMSASDFPFSEKDEAKAYVGPPSTPQFVRENQWCSIKSIEESNEWLKDLHNIVAWVGSRYAASLINGGAMDNTVVASERWLHSPLFRGGLEHSWPHIISKENEADRNEALLLQVVDNVGNGKKLLDRVRNAVNPRSARRKPTSKLELVKLKRQDSVEAILEKSGGIEAVDRAVRATFATLLKHTNASYTIEPVSSEGAIAETLVDTWKAALQLRQWYGTRLAVNTICACYSLHGLSLGFETGAPSELFSDMEMKDRQQALYNAVCEPIIRRALLLLHLAPAPVQVAPLASSPMKLLPGISTSKCHDFATVSQNDLAAETLDDPEQKRFVHQLNKVMETKSVEVMEDEDEQVQADIFSFLQQPSNTLLTSSRDNVASTSHPEDLMRDVLRDHQNRAKERLQGLKVFVSLVENTANLPLSRFHVIPMLSCAFKRLRKSDGQTVGTPLTEQASITKIHYLADLEFAGSHLSDSIRHEFFHLLTLLLEASTKQLYQMQELIEARVSAKEIHGDKLLSSSIPLAVHEILVVLEACCFPCRGRDWEHLQGINLVSLLTHLTSWKGWKTFLEYDARDNGPVDSRSTESYTILSVALGLKYPNILCSRHVTLGRDLRQLTIAHKSLDRSDGTLRTSSSKSQTCGGLAVCDKRLMRGRWYWEMSVRALGDTPVFVGVTDGTVDLNSYVPGDRNLRGVFLHHRCEEITNHIQWKCANILGVLLDCEKRQLEFYMSRKKCWEVSLASSASSGCGFYPTIGVKDADVHWHLAPSVPPKLWCASSNFQFPNAIVSGGLVAAPFDGATVCWHGRLKGRHLQLQPNGTTVCAGDSSSPQNQFETIVATQGFENQSIFVEIRVIRAGKNGKSALSFGMVSSDFSQFDEPLKHTVDVTWKNAEDVLKWGIIGVLFDFKTTTITLYSDHADPQLCHLNLDIQSKPLFPALSALCNGTIFNANFHSCPRFELPPQLFYPAKKLQNHHMSSTNELQLGKNLQLHVHFCDGGEVSTSQVARNCLLDDATVYSSLKRSNVHLVLKHELDTPMCISYIRFRGPGIGYSSPLRSAIIFITSTPPDIARYEAFDDMTAEEFAALPFPPSNGCCPRDENVPVAFFVLDGCCAQVAKRLAYPVTGRYILVKAIGPSAGTNIDIGYIGVCGISDCDNGPAYNETIVESFTCAECMKVSLYGVLYTHKEDGSIQLCAGCYDDNRGDVNAAYYAFVPDKSQDDQWSANILLCPPRQAWNDKVAVLNLPHVARTARTGTEIPGIIEKAEMLSSMASFDVCELFSCGQNNYGELGMGHCNPTSKLEPVPLFSTKSVRHMAGGNEVLVVVMKDGTVVTCGLNKNGQCGHGTFQERVLTASPVRGLAGIDVSMVAAANGCEHMLAVASDGAVYSWGYNDHGQLGLGTTISKSHTPRRIESLCETYQITMAAVSYHHSAVVSSNGELLTFGMNDCGQLGLNHTHHQHTPQWVYALASHVITKVACGLYHTVAITKGGEVYTFGKNDYGQLGLGHARNMKVPTLVKTSLWENDEKIVAVSCGYYHTVTISEKGKLLTWGRNDYGQLGIGSKDHKNSAQSVPLPLSSKIQSASCGCYHSLVLMSNGRVMVFGRNNKGQLGTGSRSLPSVDLPLPAPLSSFGNDEAVCIAAGFFSSYILTGRASESRESDAMPDGHACQVKDLPENTWLVNSDAVFESLMNEIDSKHTKDSPVSERKPRQIQRTQRKLLLVKLHAAGWAMTRALMYQSLNDAYDSSTSCSGSLSDLVNPVLSSFIRNLLENLKSLQDTSKSGDIHALEVSRASHELGASVSVKKVCFGLLQYYGTKLAPPSQLARELESNLSDTKHVYKNQILGILLVCGSANTSVASIMATNAGVIAHIISGISSSDLTSAILSIRLAMLVFPHHSVSALNRTYRSGQSTPAFSGDIVNMLMTLVGLPLLARPRLCSHELGLECTSTALCDSARCLKGLRQANGSDVSLTQQFVLEQAHVAEAKAAEVVALLRYLTLFPPWKIAINSALNRAFILSSKVCELLETICIYYRLAQKVDDIKVDIVTEDYDTTSLRRPESTTLSPETEESTSDCKTQAKISENNSRLNLVKKKAKDALDGLATVIAAVSIVGGHIEVFREGGYVSIESGGTRSSSRLGVLAGITRAPRSNNLLAQVVVDPSPNAFVLPLIVGNARVETIALDKLQVAERIPALIDMFIQVEDILMTLSSMVSTISTVEDEGALFSDNTLPQNNALQNILSNRLKRYKLQLRWRASKALSSLMNQMATLSPKVMTLDSQFVSSLTSVLSSENAIVWARKYEASENAISLEKRWLCVKQRQIFLSTEEVMDSALDHFEVDIRDNVVQKLGSENALMWGVDAIQSPRRKVTQSSLVGAREFTIGVNHSLEDGQHFDSCNEQDPPIGAWGALLPLPPLSENEQRAGAPVQSFIDYTPFPLTAPIIRVGRAVDACDLIVNDRSVSGRHFHLRRLRREPGTREDQFELQDFSKNGTIVNGVRVHGSTSRITTGSRISLILSRGGLITYEFQAWTSSIHNSAHHAPSPIFTAQQNAADLNILIPGEEYQQPVNDTPRIEPRSPAEIQNRGASGNSASLYTRQSASQGLRLTTSMAESNIPRALFSPNPAVDSPRAGGYNSPRSLVLQAPGTPALRSPIASMFSTMLPATLLSPASYQQRESVPPTESTLTSLPRIQDGGAGSMLRFALRRESVNRLFSSQRHSTMENELTQTRAIRSSGDIGLASRSITSPRFQETPVLALRLRARAHEANVVVSVTECEEALQATDNKIDEAFALIQQQNQTDSRKYRSNVRQLAVLLGRAEATCAEALRQTENDYANALRLLLSNTATDSVLSKRLDESDGTPSYNKCMSQRKEPRSNFQDIGDENPSYALTNSSAVCSSGVQRLAAKVHGSPVKARKADKSGSLSPDQSQKNSDLLLWSESNSASHVGVRQMNAFEIESEEKALGEHLATIHVRNILSQVVRLSGNVSRTEDLDLSPFSNPLVLRSLISLLHVPESSVNENVSGESEYELHKQRNAQESGKIQQILSRMTQEVMSHSTSQTLTEILTSFQNLSRLQRSIDQDTEMPHKVGWTGITRLFDFFIKNEDSGDSNAQDTDVERQPNTLEKITFDTILHILSRTLVAPTASLYWECSPLRSRIRDGYYPKGPVYLSCGLQAVLVDTYERLCSIPPPDPLLKHRRKWRKRSSSNRNEWMKSTADYALTIWRPTIPQAVESALPGKNWFCLGDVATCGNGAPHTPIVLVSDEDNRGLLMPAVRFERIDVTGKGLPRNSESNSYFHRKQLRSVWWPVAPPGYVALGCVGGTKEDPFEAPDVSCVRCVREDLVKRVDAFHCVWSAVSLASKGGGGIERPAKAKVKAKDGREKAKFGQTGRGQSSRNQLVDSSRLPPVADDIDVHTSLWTVESNFNNGLLLPVVTLDIASDSEPTSAFALNLSNEDVVLCSPTSVDSVLVFVEVLLQYVGLVSKRQKARRLVSTRLPPELPAALFALVQHVLRENQPSSGKAAVSLVRALIAVIEHGAQWHNKQSLLYCRSKMMALSQDKDGTFTSHPLLQAFAELMVAVEYQQRSSEVHDLDACLKREGGSSVSLPYRFHFSKPPFQEILVSHSSKVIVTRHLSDEERTFVLDHQAQGASHGVFGETEGLADPLGHVCSCRFEHSPALVMTMRDKVKAEVLYFETTVVEWNAVSSIKCSLTLGFSTLSFPLEGVAVGSGANDSRSYSFAPATGEVLCAGDAGVDPWHWSKPAGTMSPGDVFGCGLRLDTQEIFCCKNGRMLGIAFSNVGHPQQLHPTISFNSDCNLLVNMGTTSTKHTNFNFRFHLFDVDNFMSAFEWFEPLSQVYGVMKAMMDPSRPDKVDLDADPSEQLSAACQLPEEFMLSADNFLLDISEDVCIRMESRHPYDLDLQESFVSIPLATSIRVRLDPQSATVSSHCLQILQGGNTYGSERRAGCGIGGGGEAEVRAFTGACGGQEVIIDGDSFVWRFPVLSNFQCRVDCVRKGPYLKLEARDTRMYLVRDKGWQVAIGMARFHTGVHVWEIRIGFVTASSNIFLGIARRDVRLDSYLGKDNRGWGWIGNRALWHNGTKQRGAYGDKFKTGDIVRLTLDLRRGTLSYALNGKDFGVAFGPGGTGPKLEGTFYPGFALYNQRDSIDLIGGHRVEDGERETGFARTSSEHPSEDDMYYSEEDDEENVGGGVETSREDGAILNLRMELAMALSQMGFSIEWCLYALRRCGDDADQAANFILTNMQHMDALVREEMDMMARRARQRQSLQAFSDVGDGARVDWMALPPPRSAERRVNAARSVEAVNTSNPSTLVQEQQQLQSPRDTKWGIAFTAVPEFSVTGRRLLAAKFGSELRRLHASQRIFTLERDGALVQLVNEICELRAEALLSCDPLRMNPDEFVPTEEQIQAFPVLGGIPLKVLQRRFLVLRNFNCRLQTTLAFIDFSALDKRSLLARGVRQLRGVIFQHMKLAWWLGILKEQQAPAAARPEIEIDRHRARDALERSERGDPLACEAGERDSVFAQTFEQLHGLQPALLRGANRAFKCQFVGEFGDDFGGLYRECLAQLSSELQTFTPLLPVFRPCPNALLNVGDNRELFVPHSHLRAHPRRVQMAEFLGKLAGVAVRTKTPLDLNLPPAVWKLLVGQDVTRRDIEEIHQGCFQVVDTIANLDLHGITETMFDEIVEATFTVLSSTRETVELVPGGRSLHVRWDDREEYARAVETYRLLEFKPVCVDICRGLATILPAPTLGIFSWHELRTLVCGKASVDIDLLRRRTVYGGGCLATDAHIAYFWDVLAAFSNEQKSSFLRFVW